MLYFEESIWGEGENNGEEDDPENSLCPAEAPTGIDALACEDSRCQGVEGRCTQVSSIPPTTSERCLTNATSGSVHDV